MNETIRQLMERKSVRAYEPADIPEQDVQTILAAAVQDHGRGVLVGTRSYGKGVVQTVVGFEEDGSGMQYTSSCYYTPNGSNIHGTGVAPDIVVEADEDDAISQGPDIARDAQLRAAVEALDGFPEAEDAA